MRVTLICCFFLALWDGNTGLINAEILVHTGTEGGNITVLCSFSFSGVRRIFCKGECKDKDILVETTGDRAQSGRYSIEYKKGFYPARSTLLYVSITNLTKSDSGRYRCVLDRPWLPDSYEEFEIRVTDAPTSLKPNWTPRPSPTSVPSASTPTTAQSSSSSSGSFTSSSSSASSSSASTESTNQQQHAAQQTTGVLLYVGLILVVMVVVLSAAVLIFCRKRASRPKEADEDTEYANVTVANRVDEEMREDRQSRSPPVEVSTVYTYTKYAKQNGDETTDDYSFVTAATFPNRTEGDSSKLTYSSVDFSGPTTTSLHSAPCGDSDSVVYSVPRVGANSDAGHAEDASPPLYSTVTLHQL